MRAAHGVKHELASPHRATLPVKPGLACRAGHQRDKSRAKGWQQRISRVLYGFHAEYAPAWLGSFATGLSATMSLSHLLLLAQAAPAAPSGQGNLMGMVVPIILMFVIFYFLLIKPQQKRQKEHAELVKALKAGDKVLTNGGIFGEVTQVSDRYITVEIADKVRVKVSPGSITGRLTGDADVTSTDSKAKA
jgi:preprotein translocase subunit YajC